MPSAAPKSFARPVTVSTESGGFSSTVVVALGAVAAAAVLWGGAATWYIVYKDDFVQTFLARQAEMRFAYEDRVSDLKNRLEREITSGLVERKGFGSRVDALVKRQQEIEARQIWLASLTERIGGGTAIARANATPDSGTLLPNISAQTFRSVEQTGSIPFPSSYSSKPTPVQDTPLDLRLRNQGEDATAPRTPDRLSAVEESLHRMSKSAIETTDMVRRNARERAQAVRQALAATRVPLPVATTRDVATGGPFIPATDAYDSTAFMPLAADAEGGIADLERLTTAARTLPLGKPLVGELEQTSSFGYRVDPFNRSAALHSGVDFRAALGASVKATAAGRVTVAEYTGGYGNMVEIEHENGVSTRYGHLSAISVTSGQRVTVGQVVGRAGSTGRSTGNHLHYETRIDGEAVNPARFLEAARLLAKIE